MNYAIQMLSKLWLFLIILSLAITFPLSFAQHHGGEQAPPISFGTGEVTVSTFLIPTDFTPEKYRDANLKIRFFDPISNMNIENVSYRIQIFYGSQLVANQMFFDNDGELEIKIQPTSGCQQEELWKCTKYFGDVDPVVPNALTSTPSSIPVISGPVFVNSGEYTVKTDIIGAKNPKTQTSQDIHFETIVIIPNEQHFKIFSSGIEYSITATNFQEPIQAFQYDDSSKSLSFQIPFNWEHVEHVSSIQNYFEIPKNFLPFQNVDSFFGKVNNVLIFPRDLHLDKYSNENNNVLHFMISSTELTLLKNSDSKLNIVIMPEPQSFIVTKDLFFDNGIKALVSYDPRYSKSNDFLFSVVFFDTNSNIVSDIRYGYGLKDPTGKETANIGPNNSGIVLHNGIDSRILDSPTSGKYTMQMVLLGIGNDSFDVPLFAKFDFEIVESETTKTVNSEYQIPSWIKNNAGWWADNKIDDNSFIQGIQFLIKEHIMSIPSTQHSVSGSNEIPSWIKNNAGWWASGKIDDNSFVQGIQFLIKEGIINP
ncbi:MAG TPA: peptidase [Nitrosarchaeum sp.]|nr:peptidase [Nitrosarchaeum sp.]